VLNNSNPNLKNASSKTLFYLLERSTLDAFPFYTCFLFSRVVSLLNPRLPGLSFTLEKNSTPQLGEPSRLLRILNFPPSPPNPTLSPLTPPASHPSLLHIPPPPTLPYPPLLRLSHLSCLPSTPHPTASPFTLPPPPSTSPHPHLPPTPHPPIYSFHPPHHQPPHFLPSSPLHPSVPNLYAPPSSRTRGPYTPSPPPPQFLFLIRFSPTSPLLSRVRLILQGARLAWVTSAHPMNDLILFFFCPPLVREVLYIVSLLVKGRRAKDCFCLPVVEIERALPQVPFFKLSLAFALPPLGGSEPFFPLSDGG